MYKVITIGRQFGSGGREFGRRLAEELGYEYYDKEIISFIFSNGLRWNESNLYGYHCI